MSAVLGRALGAVGEGGGEGRVFAEGCGCGRCGDEAAHAEAASEAAHIVGDGALGAGEHCEETLDALGEARAAQADARALQEKRVAATRDAEAGTVPYVRVDAPAPAREHAEAKAGHDEEDFLDPAFAGLDQGVEPAAMAGCARGEEHARQAPKPGERGGGERLDQVLGEGRVSVFHGGHCTAVSNRSD